MWTWLNANSDAFQAIGNIIQIPALIILIITLCLAIRQLKVSISQTQGNTVSHIAETGRNLFLKAMGDRDLEVIFQSSPKVSNEEKVNQFIGVLIQHYSHAFSQRKLKNIPDYFWAEIVRDAKTFFKMDLVKKKRNHIVQYYDPDFAKFVDEIIDS